MDQIEKWPKIQEPKVHVRQENSNKLIIYPWYAVHMFKNFLFMLYTVEIYWESWF